MTFTAVAEIGWKQLNGRKTVHRLHPAMLGDGGHLKELEVQPVPKSDSHPKAVYSVLFDRSYAVEKLSFELGKCGDVPFLDLVELMAHPHISQAQNLIFRSHRSDRIVPSTPL